LKLRSVDRVRAVDESRVADPSLSATATAFRGRYFSRRNEWLPG